LEGIGDDKVVFSKINAEAEKR